MFQDSRLPLARNLLAAFLAHRLLRGEPRIPLVVENVKGAQPWVGRARWHYGSFYLWGDVPALMPSAHALAKVPGLNWSGSDKPGYVARAFNDTAVKVASLSGRRTDVGNGVRFTSRDYGIEGTKYPISGHAWYRESHGQFGSKTPRRKAASAQIAKIPLPLSTWIAKTYRPGPENDRACSRQSPLEADV